MSRRNSQLNELRSNWRSVQNCDDKQERMFKALKSYFKERFFIDDERVDMAILEAVNHTYEHAFMDGFDEGWAGSEAAAEEIEQLLISGIN